MLGRFGVCDAGGFGGGDGGDDHKSCDVAGCGGDVDYGCNDVGVAMMIVVEKVKVAISSFAPGISHYGRSR